MYGLSEAATTFSNGQAIGHWGSTKVIVSAGGGGGAARGVRVHRGTVAARAGAARVLKSRDRTAAYLISLCIGTAIFGMFFFMTLFVQEVWGYSPVRSGIAYLPMVGLIVVGAALSSQLVARIGARPLITFGPLLAAAACSGCPDHRAQHLRGRPARADDADRPRDGADVRAAVAGGAGEGAEQGHRGGVVAANTGQQVGGSIGLAISARCWSAVASNTKSAIAATHGAHLSTAAQTALSNNALAYGFGKGYLVSAGISLLAVVIAVVMIRIKRADLEGIDPMAAPV